MRVLVRVPDGREFKDQANEEELLLRLAEIYRPSEVERIGGELRRLRRTDVAGAEALRSRYLARMYDLSRFVQELKGRFAQWYNRENGRHGYLWEDRFISVVVEGGCALETVAAYIDLNPVRAGIVRDPKDYRWSGYGEAVAGVERSELGLCRVVDPEGSGWSRSEVLAAYR